MMSNADGENFVRIFYEIQLVYFVVSGKFSTFA